MKIGVLWDLDGTLLDTLEDLADAVNYALAQKKHPPRTYSEIRDFVGNGALNLIRRAAPEGTPEEQILEILGTFRAYYMENANHKTCPFPAVAEALQAVEAQYPVAIVSNKPDGAVKALCNVYFPGIYALGETPDCPRKPAPDMVKRAMAELGVDTCVYVGDSEVDLRTAQNAEVPCLSVVWGFRDECVLKEAGATHFCRKPSQLPALIDQMIKELF